MASIRKEQSIRQSPDRVWDAVRDVGALHTRLVAGFMTDCRLDGDARIVSFANGMTARELIVDVDDDQRRLCWAAVGAPIKHHNASLVVLADGDGHSRAVWRADLLPNELAPTIEAMMVQGLAAMKHTLEESA